jgi:hypothetical protein
MPAKIKVVDLTSNVEEGESAAMVYFEELNGIVHIYRDGTVVLSSPMGTTVTSFRQPNDPDSRNTLFLGMLARLGATEEELVAAAQMIARRDDKLQQMGFQAVLDEASKESVEQFRSWCAQHNLEVDNLDESDLEQLVEQAIRQVRSR